ncbi:MAG TPA: SRPBCC family protein [Bacteroidia bacterium]|jgi:uncharacterized protein YndB with AHSA1/START domain|nr:SRPBCC family protein [Bacteroidia bacterium]
METKEKTAITVQAVVSAPVEKVWKCWTDAEHIMKWNNASDDWHTPKAVNDPKPGGKFVYTMASKDGKMSFDFGGVYDRVEYGKEIAYTIGDGRKVKVIFESEGNATKITETFEAEDQNPVEMQRGGWQSILDNFKKHTEGI